MGLLNWLNTIDSELLLYLNSFHSELFDKFWWSVTRGIYWLPFILTILVVIFKNKQREGILIIVAIAITILLTDQFAGLLKESVGRLRPSRDPGLMYDVHIVNGYRGGLYSFVSAHAANTFGVAMLLTYIVKSYRFAVVILLWALLNGYSRIYLGVHFPFDVIAGAIVGVLVGWGVFRGLTYVKVAMPAFSALVSDKSNTDFTNGGFRKSHINLIILIFVVSLFFFFV